MPSLPTELRDLPSKSLITLRATPSLLPEPGEDIPSLLPEPGEDIPSLLPELEEDEPHLGLLLDLVPGLFLFRLFVVALVSAVPVVLELIILQPTVS